MLQEATHIVRTLTDAGHTAYFAGGSVRDRLLGREARDLDIASSAGPEEVESLFPHTHAIGKAFGVIQVVENGHTFEVATFRQEFGYLDGRHPSAIVASTPVEDAQRRDFTINGLFYDPLRDQLIDYVEGQKDCANRIIRAIGDPEERFQEDHLRMLRAVRFAATLDFAIEEQTLLAIQRNAEKINRISVERVRDEITRLFTEAKRPGDALELLSLSGLLAYILPQALALKGCEQPPEFHPEGDVWTHTVMMLNELEEPSVALAFAVLLHDIGKPATYEEVTLDTGVQRIRFTGHAQVGARMAREWLSHYRFSKVHRDAIVTMVDRHMNFMNVRHMKQNTLRKLIGDPLFDQELELHRIDCKCSNGITESVDLLTEARDRFSNEPVLPDPWITGKDLLELGLSPGPDLGKWKQAAYDRQLNAHDQNRDELLRWIRRELS